MFPDKFRYAALNQITFQSKIGRNRYILFFDTQNLVAKATHNISRMNKDTFQQTKLQKYILCHKSI